jgi:hypothetical protein
MINIDLNKYGVQEMNQIELVNNEGGSFIQWFKDFVNPFLPSTIQLN